MGYVEHWLLTASSAIGILALMLIVRWREKRKKRMYFENSKAAV